MKKIIKLLFIPLAITPFFLCSCKSKDIEKIGKEVGSRINGENQILIEKLNKIINEQREKINTKENNIEYLKKEIDKLKKDLENNKKYKEQELDSYKRGYDIRQQEKLKELKEKYEKEKYDLLNEINELKEKNKIYLEQAKYGSEKKVR